MTHTTLAAAVSTDTQESKPFSEIVESKRKQLGWRKADLQRAIIKKHGTSVSHSALIWALQGKTKNPHPTTRHMILSTLDEGIKELEAAVAAHT